MTKRMLIGTTVAGAAFMTSGFSRIQRPFGLWRLVWRAPLAPSRVRFLERVGFVVNARRTVATADLAYARVLRGR